MKANEFIGMKVLDKEANEVGKVEDIAIVFGKCLVNKIFIATGSALNKKYMVIVNDDIAEVGDYLQIKLNKAEIEDHKIDKIDDNLGNGIRFNNFTGKTVISINGMEIGKVTDMAIDPKGCIIHNIIVTSGNALNKKNLMVSNEYISAIGDYLILKLDQEQVKERII
ncbi:PRC-barrel domain-containing protein, partial [Methanobacterium sp.]|uniref:PRC-barrel domain-containing protein n=1 Tax=Methanobacterium sp. TaxID=2164 RepID=UPI003C721E15